MRIAIIGAGGVGGYFGGRLARAGNEVVFIARGRSLEALRTEGLHVKSIHGDFVVSPAQATEEPASVGPVDAVLVCVKAWQIEEVAPTLAPLLGEDTVVVPLQNGVEASGILASVLGERHAADGFCRIISRIAAPGHIAHEGAEPYVGLSERDRRPSERLARLVSAFREAGVKAEVPADIDVAIWEKFLFIASVSGVGGVTRARMGVLRSVPETRAMLVGALREVDAVARARGVKLDDAVIERTMRYIDSMPEGATASMQRDLMEGRPSELEFQNGAVVRLGKAAGVPTPIHAFLYASLLPMELVARAKV